MNQEGMDDSTVAECRKQGGVWCKISWSFREGPNPPRSFRLKLDFIFRDMRSHSKDSGKECVGRQGHGHNQNCILKSCLSLKKEFEQDKSRDVQIPCSSAGERRDVFIYDGSLRDGEKWADSRDMLLH